MSAVRMNITLPEDLAQELDAVVEPRRKSRFIAEAVRRRIEEVHREKLEALLEEGYKANAPESEAMAREFEAIDLEGWDEY